jgi:hypothetical protein
MDNHRVMRWDPGAEHGIIVAGGNGSGIRLNQLTTFAVELSKIAFELSGIATELSKLVVDLSKIVVELSEDYRII